MRGQTTYISDLAAKAGAAKALILRSTHPHALIRSVRIASAENVEGVLAVLTAKNLSGISKLPCDWVPETILNEAHHPILAEEHVLYVGQPVAAIIATNQYAAQDALDLIKIV